MKKMIALITALSVTAGLLSGCSDKEEKGGKIHLEFFQNKPEAVGTFDKLIAKFEKEHPNIDIQQNNVPDAETVLRTRLVKEDVPDILGIGGNATYGDIAEAGVFYDFTKDPVVDKVIPNYVDTLNQLAGNNKEVNGIPFATNANMVLYNKEKFRELGLDVPRTWDELIGTAKKIKAAGEVPFYLTLKDAWTAMVPFNSLVANTQGNNFFEEKNEGQASFQKRYGEASDKMLTLLKYGHKDNFGRDYNSGNKAFANGESFMYLQGNWAISSIKTINKDIDIGTFPLPATNDPKKNKLVSGVDTALTMAKDNPYKKESLLFINFLLKPENTKLYMKDQNSFSAVKGVLQDDPTLSNLNPYFEKQQITGFPEHFFPASIPIANLVQGFLISKDEKEFLKKLDTEWDKVKVRQ
ncbi:ABC transporter substrate-binding protein [Fictibacillus fluitans]|uniref:Extracellular solute-binding protein n=1 Tax=Fictibacillus fluitans TaxID=3058422 RepID=A0ABT8I311_9BACL|nr:extracellular solute-binding protein [Fictibacillus sp. NE201]MDN4526877.1 extracellular solute-binding protein [Fictibacillus sp. NE201]